VSTDAKTYRAEDDWTRNLAARLSRRPDVKTGIGDDAAVVASPGLSMDLVYTTDAVIAGVHFLPGAEPRRIGRKMVGRLLSDLAAIGAEPGHILLNLVAPTALAMSGYDEIYRGAEHLAASFGASIVGGDTVVASPLALHGFAAGRLPAGTAVLRSGAQPGDFIYVTGNLGGSISGKHLDFTPRVREGVWLRTGGWPTSMIDVSDGLASDLHRICQQSRVGAELEAAALPVNLDINHALYDGEDYELLFTIPAPRAIAFEPAWKAFTSLPCVKIGTILESTNPIALRHPDHRLEPLYKNGFDHMRTRNEGPP
jgi:thiamine-monophosphate kinase